MAVFLPAQAYAQDTRCHAAMPTGMAVTDLPAAQLDWHCDESDPDLTVTSTVLRFQAEDPDVRFFQARIGKFSNITLLSIGADGAQESRAWRASEIDPLISDRLFALPLPITGTEASTHYAVFERVNHPSTVTQAELVVATGENASGNLAGILLVAIIVGFLLLPILIDLAFYRVLRARFLLWHAGLAFSMAIYVMSSGIIVAFVPLTVSQLSFLSVVAFSAVCITCLMFFSRFVEPDRISPQLRQLLALGAALIAMVTIVRLVGMEALRPYAVKLYFAAFLPILILMAWGMIEGARNGSRAVWFQIVAWTPLLLLGLVRIFSMVVTQVPYIEGSWIFRVGAAFEVVVTALGVVDRVVAIKRQRDTAQAHAAILESEAERDALTGLYNRRSIESRFAALAQDGFDTVAVLDLDHFKQINDDFGHGVGDDALRAVAVALEPDEDTRVIRLGGEEFAIILRGKKPVERAERRRQAIPRQVAAITQVNRPVTASMGVVHAPDGEHSFETLYRLADKLLYEAKVNGRNRMLSERLKVFDPRQRDDRRGSDRRAAA
ncbi:diguanylate cyclase [Erythrobacter alti]|uniref:GGDEF domain-containing protein n=1 Tax=Erythrobacter alti TaxID=1896145 RepID=UPI0030F3BEF3